MCSTKVSPTEVDFAEVQEGEIKIITLSALVGFPPSPKDSDRSLYVMWRFNFIAGYVVSADMSVSPNKAKDDLYYLIVVPVGVARETFQ